MPFPTDAFDAATLALMRKAFDAAWEEAAFALVREDKDLTALRAMMALRIMKAVREGERDPEQLMALALDAVR